VGVIGHDRKRVDVPDAANHGQPELFLEPIVVDVVVHDVLPPLAAGDDMIDRLRVVKAQSSWQGAGRDILAIGSQEKS
jgi:hypothetical protein